MRDAKAFAEYWKDRIEYDLGSFIDPGTTVSVDSAGRNLRVQWTMHGADQEALFSTSPDRGVSVKVNGNSLAYRSFLAGPNMADLKTVARMILQASRPGLFVPTRAEVDDSENIRSQSGPAVEVLTDLLEDESDDATRVVMVTGGAGAGKTSVLRELVRLQADKYVRGQTTKLLLYVNAQGRALARLHEALATELQDLKVGLTYHSVAVLTRLGILVPVIDGFDELLGVSGYDDAFSSLASFLEELKGEGQLLTSARSVYYEEEFLARADRVSGTEEQAWKHWPVRVLDWEEGDRQEYLDEWTRREGISESDSMNLRSRVHVVIGRGNQPLASKPLFFTRMVALLQRNPGFSGSEDLLRELVDDYLNRERKEKLLDRQAEPLLTEEQFERLMRELAEEMWNQETRELDYRSVREVAGYVMETEALPETTKQIIVERIPTLAFLAQSDGTGSHTGVFEHEAFFFYFLAGRIASQLASGRDMEVILSRSALPEDVADRVAMELSAQGIDSKEGLQELLDRLAAAGIAEWRRTTQVRENAGLIVMALCRVYARHHQGKVDGRAIRSVVFPGSHLRDVALTRCSLTGVTVRRTDLGATRFEDCKADEHTLFIEPRVRLGSTRLELRGLTVAQVTGIHRQDDGSSGANYDPSDVAKVLKECGAPIPSDPQGRSGPKVPSEYRELLRRLMRAYHRANPVCIGDQNLKGIFDDPGWETLERLLIRHNLVSKETRSTKGQTTHFLRRKFLPERLMSGLNGSVVADERIRAFWRALELETHNAT